MVSKFPTIIKASSKIKPMHNAIPSASEGTILVEPVAFSEQVLAAAVIFIFFLVLTERLKRWINSADDYV